MRLRAHLLVLAFTTMLPVVVFALVVGYFLIHEQRETFRRGAEERTLAVLSAVDNDLNGSISALAALTTLPALDEGDFATFRNHAERVLATQPDWQNVNLALPDGQQVMNLQVPPGMPLPNIGKLDGSFELLRATGKPVISDLAVGPVLKRSSFAVRVPVVRDGRIRYVLSAGVKADAIRKVIRAQGLPPDWVGVIVDRKGRIVSRNVDPAQTEGQLASPSLREALQRSDSGWFRGTTIEGSAVYTPFRRSDSSGWAFAMGIPAHAVDESAWRATGLLIVGLLAALALAFALANVGGRRISSPIAALAAAATAIGRGERVKVPEAGSVDEIQRLSRTVREAVEALQAVDRQKDEFLAMLSHELRNPLAAMSTATHLLAVSDPAGEDAVAARAIIERQTRRMARLVGDLLDISRLTMGKLALQQEPFDLAQTVSGVVNLWRASGRLEGHDVVLDLAPAWVHADRTRVEQIIDNLLDNAVKFTPAPGRIALHLAREAGVAVLRVSDEGIGLSPEESGRVFELFAQGERSQRQGGGLGIGLALVKQLAEVHGGSVRVSSEGIGKGATFEVKLPLAARPAAV
jgi:signal transduction histidine kinase